MLVNLYIMLMELTVTAKSEEKPETRIIEIKVELGMVLKKTIIFIPSIEKGGVERNTIWVANELVKRKIEVDIVCVRIKDGQREKFDKEVRLIEFDNRKHPFLNQRLSDAVNIRKEFDLYLKRQERKNTVVLSFQSSIVSVGICKRNHIGIICRLSNHPVAVKYEKSILRKLSELIKPYYYSKADLVIANSKRLADDFAAKISKPVETVYNPIHLRHMEALSEELIEEELEVEAKKYKGRLVLSAGRLVIQKDYGTLLEGIALSRHKNEIKVWILGDGCERRNIEGKIRQLGLENTVRLLGYKNNVYAYMKRASVYIQTSLYEGCPNALIEAVAMGIPAIAANCLSGPEEVLLGGKGGTLIDIKSPKQVAQSLDGYFEHPQDFYEKQKKACAAIDRFDNNKIMDRYLQFMRKVLEENAR